MYLVFTGGWILSQAKLSITDSLAYKQIEPQMKNQKIGFIKKTRFRRKFELKRERLENEKVKSKELKI
jgi:hypothetical protein